MNEGFVEVYSDFSTFTRYAYEIIPTKPLIVDLNGSLIFKKLSGENMPVKYNEETGIYSMDRPYSSGTQFKFYMNNNEPAYVYAFGSDLSNRIFRIFPLADSISAYLGYKSNQIAIPDEDHYIYLDNNTGKDIFCVLYSKYRLDMDEILSRMEKASGNFRSRLETVLSGKLIKEQNIEYEKSTISFKAKSGEMSIVTIILEITHN